MAYKHGIYGETDSAVGIAEISQGTIPAYIGTLPAHRIKDENLVNVKHGKSENCIMLLINSFKDVKKLNIFSNDWDTYSLCEVMDVHFNNMEADTAPIILIGNVNSAQESEATTATVTVTKSGTSHVGYLEDARAVIDTMAITASSATLTEDEVTYTYDGDKIKIVITKADFAATSVDVTYNKVTEFKLSTVEFTEALELLDRVENITDKVPNIICAPQYSNEVQFHDLMVQKAIDKVALKWNVVCFSDIGNKDITSNEIAISWKKTNSYNHVLDKVFYPKVAYNGKPYHLSVIASAKAQMIDTENDGIPYESASNKEICADSIVDASGKTVYLSENEANELNKNGITTAISMKGQIRMWGSHMANYDYDHISNIPYEERFDVAVRMSAYMRNYLQYNYLDEIDKTITRKDIDSIINSIQMWLDSLVNGGMLLYATVEFDGDSDIMDGNLVFNIHVTYPIVAKSITFKVISTDKGFSVITEGEEGGAE